MQLLRYLDRNLSLRPKKVVLISTLTFLRFLTSMYYKITQMFEYIVMPSKYYAKKYARQYVDEYIDEIKKGAYDISCDDSRISNSIGCQHNYNDFY